MIAEERKEQIEKHGYTIEKDVIENRFSQLTDAAMMLLMTDRHKLTPPSFWDVSIWKRMIAKPEKERMIVSAALLAAEIDRIQSMEE